MNEWKIKIKQKNFVIVAGELVPTVNYFEKKKGKKENTSNG